jgi:hypothetical protein
MSAEASTLRLEHHLSSESDKDGSLGDGDFDGAGNAGAKNLVLSPEVGDPAKQGGLRGVEEEEEERVGGQTAHEMAGETAGLPSFSPPQTGRNWLRIAHIGDTVKPVLVQRLAQAERSFCTPLEPVAAGGDIRDPASFRSGLSTTGRQVRAVGDDTEKDSKLRSIFRINRLRKPDSLFQFRVEVCTGSGAARI